MKLMTALIVSTFLDGARIAERLHCNYWKAIINENINRAHLGGLWHKFIILVVFWLYKLEIYLADFW